LKIENGKLRSAVSRVPPSEIQPPFPYRMVITKTFLVLKPINNYINLLQTNTYPKNETAFRNKLGKLFF
jgi:hypothetical protein